MDIRCMAVTAVDCKTELVETPVYVRAAVPLEDAQHCLMLQCALAVGACARLRPEPSSPCPPS